MKIAALIVLAMAAVDLALGLLGVLDAPISMLGVHAP
jgi:hypothetical protein